MTMKKDILFVIMFEAVEVAGMGQNEHHYD